MGCVALVEIKVGLAGGGRFVFCIFARQHALGDEVGVGAVARDCGDPVVDVRPVSGGGTAGAGGDLHQALAGGQARIVEVEVAARVGCRQTALATAIEV